MAARIAHITTPVAIVLIALVPAVHLLAWSDFPAEAQTGRAGPSERATGGANPRHTLLSEELNRDVYNQVVELQRLLQSGSWQEATRVVTQLDLTAARGVAPAPGEPAVLVSLSTALRRFWQEYPQLEQQLSRDFADLAQLKMQRAIQSRDSRQVEMLALQFRGTAAARQGSLWLGDQALAGGRGAQAMMWYQQAGASGQHESDDSVAARWKLASAVAGVADPLPPIDSPVRVGDVEISAEELASITQQLRAKTGRPPASPFPALQAPGNDTTLRRDIEQPLQIFPGGDVARERLQSFRSAGIDGIGRHLTMVCRERWLLIHNRFELLTLDADNGKLLWSSQHPTDVVLSSADWPLVPMVPLIYNGQVVARQLDGDAPRLGCWDITNGQLLWTDSLEDQIPVSDPFLLASRLAVLTLSKPEVEGLLQLAWLDPHSGRVNASVPLLRLRQPWWQRRICQVQATEDQFSCALGGVVFSADSDGQVRWIRSQPTASSDGNPNWAPPWHQPPLLCRDLLLITQPGVPQAGTATVEALERATAVRRWRTEVPRLQQIVGCLDHSVIVQSEAGIASLDLSTGATLWEHTESELLTPALCLASDGDAGPVIVCTRRRSPVKDHPAEQIEFVWLDPSGGHPQAALPIGSLPDGRWELGPMLPVRDAIWMLLVDGAVGSELNLWRLVREPAGRISQ